MKSRGNKKKTCFIFHDSYQNPRSAWYIKVGQFMANSGYEVFIPEFPTPEKQSYASWREVFVKYKNFVHDDTVFIAHGTGAIFAMKLLGEEETVKAGYTFLISPTSRKTSNKSYNILNYTFLKDKFGWDAIKKSSKFFSIIYSNNDDFVPAHYSEELRRYLPARMFLVKGAEHFTDASVSEKIISLVGSVLGNKPITQDELMKEVLTDIGETYTPIEKTSKVWESVEKRGLDNLYTDLSESIQDNSPSDIVKILEDKRNQERTEKLVSKKKTFTKLTVSLIVILLVATSYLFYTFASATSNFKLTDYLPEMPWRKSDELKQISLSKFIQAEIDVVGLGADEIYDAIDERRRSGEIFPENFEILNFRDGETYWTSEDFLTKLNLGGSLLLRQEIADKFMYGFYHSLDGKTPFLAFKVDHKDIFINEAESWMSSSVAKLARVLGLDIENVDLSKITLSDDRIKNIPLSKVSAEFYTTEMKERIESVYDLENDVADDLVGGDMRDGANMPGDEEAVFPAIEIDYSSTSSIEDFNVLPEGASYVYYTFSGDFQIVANGQTFNSGDADSFNSYAETHAIDAFIFKSGDEFIFALGKVSDDIKLFIKNLTLLEKDAYSDSGSKIYTLSYSGTETEFTLLSDTEIIVRLVAGNDGAPEVGTNIADNNAEVGDIDINEDGATNIDIDAIAENAVPEPTGDEFSLPNIQPADDEDMSMEGYDYDTLFVKSEAPVRKVVEENFVPAGERDLFYYAFTEDDWFVMSTGVDVFSEIKKALLNK